MQAGLAGLRISIDPRRKRNAGGLLGKAIDHAQAKPRTLADLLGGKEGFNIFSGIKNISPKY
jgi:hypothetical protein